MNNKKMTIKNTICYFITFILLAIACACFLNIKTRNTAFAATGMNEIDISNGNFDESTKTSYPYSPSSFDAYIYNTKVNSNTTPNVNAGVIKLSDLDDEDFASRLSNVTVDDALGEDYVLFIDSYDYDNDTILNANYGYRTSSSISLEANKNYMLTINVMTLDNSNLGNLYLYNSDSTIFSSMTDINSYMKWTTHYFFVSTNNDALDLTLGMYLDGQGTVLFDNIACHEISDSVLNAQLSTIKDDYKVYVDEEDKIVNNYTVDINANKFVSTIDSSSTNLINNGFVLGQNSADYTYLTTTNDDNTTALMLHNVKKTYSTYATNDNFLTFEQNKLYQVSVSLKLANGSDNFNGKATLQLIETNVDTADAKNSEVISITSTTSSSINNGYKDYTFYVNSNPTKDTTYKLVFGLGDADTYTIGKLYINNVKVSLTNYSTFSSASSTNKLDLASKSIYSDSAIMLDNGNFNGMKINDYNTIYPATPIDWTESRGAHTQYLGVINTKADNISNLINNGMSSLYNPYSTETNENVLLMYNTTKDTATYTSESKSLSKNTYHKFQIEIQTMDANAKISLVTNKDNQEVELSSITLSNNKEWKQVTLYLYTGHQALNVSMKITLESEGCGFLFADNARFDYPDTSKTLQAQFESSINSSTTVVTDLSNMLASTSSKQWAETTYFSTNGSTNAKSGIIDLTNSETLTTDDVISSEDLSKFIDIESLTALGIRINNGYYLMTSNIGYDLVSEDDTCYKISVSVFTKYLTEAINDDEKNGVNISLTNFDIKFTNIVSDGDWTTYTFYIDPNEATTTYLELGIGSEENPCSGTVYFSDIKFETINSATFSTETKYADDNAQIKVLEDIYEKEEDDDTKDTDDTTTNNNTNWIYYIPSLLFGIAIVIAIVGVLSRKIKWKKPAKKSKNAYDRNSTVSKQLYMRRATTIRENRLAELNKDLEKMTAERNSHEAQYKQNLTKLREMKIKRANTTEIAKLEKEIKKAQKLSASIGMTINNINSEISYTKTDAYMNNLVKKLSRETIKDTENEQE